MTFTPPLISALTAGVLILLQSALVFAAGLGGIVARQGTDGPAVGRGADGGMALFCRHSRADAPRGADKRRVRPRGAGRIGAAPGDERAHRRTGRPG